ncbi:hypothetical protein Ga0074812_15224 [Parafrankia irregularis]|uniref:Uncharacterized protein n=2 Tax=Frankiaceae TaxID=74712 RepID=A0A0S4QZQ4_9ACTN|nr:hypothetical protein Ga0074812_15224 [Parafrankia irregularis]
MTSAALVHQEWVYTVRDVVHPKLQRVDDQAGTLWFITVSLDGSLEGESSLSSRSMAPFLCRSCGKGYGLPDDVHVTVPYSVVIDSISPGQIVEITH